MPFQALCDDILISREVRNLFDPPPTLFSSSFIYVTEKRTKECMELNIKSNSERYWTDQYLSVKCPFVAILSAFNHSIIYFIAIGMFTYNEKSRTYWFSKTCVDNDSEFNLVGVVSFLRLIPVRFNKELVFS